MPSAFRKLVVSLFLIFLVLSSLELPPGCLVFSLQWYVVFSIPEAFIDFQYEPFELLFTIEQSGHYFPILGVLIVVVYYSFCILV
ncbi:hypothetical protein DENSPDRAFT_87174 [Dentipellis sp. KUC8613]|nr:hypothetical protein DENSPDRAFT_87174 [Dentipellis sp. KUC8613]